MGEAILFEAKGTDVVEAKSGRMCGAFSSTKAAHRICAHLTEEHREGRVPQAKCSKGEPCDFDRINVPVRDFRGSHADRSGFVVLCEHHRAKA